MAFQQGTQRSGEGWFQGLDPRPFETDRHLLIDTNGFWIKTLYAFMF